MHKCRPWADVGEWFLLILMSNNGGEAFFHGTKLSPVLKVSKKRKQQLGGGGRGDGVNESRCLGCNLTFSQHTAGAQPDSLSDTRAALHKGTLCAHFAMRVRRLICFLPFAPQPCSPVRPPQGH